MTEGRGNYEFISEISEILHEKVILKQLKYIDGNFVKEFLTCNIYLLIYDTNVFLNKNTFDLINQQRKNAKINTERIISIMAIIEIHLFTHHL